MYILANGLFHWKNTVTILDTVLGWEGWGAAKVLNSILILFLVKRSNFMFFQTIKFSRDKTEMENGGLIM